MKCIKLPVEKYEALSETYSADLIPEGKIRDYVRFQNRLYVCVGKVSRGIDGPRLGLLHLREIIPLGAYKGPTFSYADKSASSVRGEAFYQGVRVRCKNQPFVLSTPFEATVSDQVTEPVQGSLFL